MFVQKDFEMKGIGTYYLLAFTHNDDTRSQAFVWIEPKRQVHSFIAYRLDPLAAAFVASLLFWEGAGAFSPWKNSFILETIWSERNLVAGVFDAEAATALEAVDDGGEGLESAGTSSSLPGWSLLTVSQVNPSHITDKMLAALTCVCMENGLNSSCKQAYDWFWFFFQILKSIYVVNTQYDS